MNTSEPHALPRRVVASGFVGGLVILGRFPSSTALGSAAVALLAVGLRTGSSALLLAAAIPVALRATGGLARVSRWAVSSNFTLRGSPLTRVMGCLGATAPVVIGLPLAAGAKAGAGEHSWLFSLAVGLVVTIPTWRLVEVVMVSASFRRPFSLLRDYHVAQLRSLWALLRRRLGGGFRGRGERRAV
jgi:hypothetical protein